jgi:inorganic triphosphatase YgiF
VSLAAIYLDTPDRRLAKAGLSWRLRREGKRWVQTLKAAGACSLERFGHEVIRPDATHDASAHAGTPAGKRLVEVLDQAREDGIEVGARFSTAVRRTRRRLRVRGTMVDVAFDEGRLIAGDNALRLCELEFEQVSGSVSTMLALAERWRKRFDLVYEPRTKAERGDRLAEGERFPAVRKAQRPKYPGDATACDALGAVLDECMAHINRNAIGLSEGDPAHRIENVHQLRVGVRRLRSALRSFEGWTPAPPAELVDGLKAVFTELGMSRDSDVLKSGVAAALAQVGAPRLEMSKHAKGRDPAQVVGDAQTQRVFLGWIAWRTSLVESVQIEALRAGDEDGEEHHAGAAAGHTSAEPEDDLISLPRKAERRLRRWHRRIAADAEVFDRLDEPSLHTLRKRIKRQRYAVEFFTPVLRRREVERYLKPLAVVQGRMGELNDLFVARTLYQDLVNASPEAWFALGWIAARIAEIRAQAKSDLRTLAEAHSPARGRGSDV